MKILLSPSKTKTLQGKATAPVFAKALTEAIVAHMQTLSAEAIMKALKVKEDMAADLVEFYQNYETAPEGAAALSYSGLVFKNLAWQDLSEKAQAFGNDHVCILSALYGVVTPQSPVTDYRLDLVDRIFAKNVITEPVAEDLLKDAKSLYDCWTGKVTAYFQKEDWLLNLASKEYSKLVTHPHIVTVEFLELKQGVWKQLSTSSKQMRGRLAHYMIAHELTEWTDLPAELDGFVKDTDLPATLTEPLTVAYRRSQ